MKLVPRLAAAAAVSLCAASLAAAPPAPVSPGESDSVATVTACPTFSWSAAPQASGYELVVYRLAGEEALSGAALGEPVLRRGLPAGATSWTPALESCLEPGERYAWLVRALGESDPSSWSAPLLFRVGEEAATAELRRALEVVQHDLGTARVGEPTLGTAEADSLPTRAVGTAESPRRANEGNETREIPLGGGPATAVRGEVPDVAGETYGVRGVANSPDGAGVRADNNDPSGADVVLGGTPVAKMTESSFSRDTASNLTFEFDNPGTGAMTLQVEGVEVVTTATDQDTLGGLSCALDQIAKFDGANWVCALDGGGTEYFPGNQLELVGATFNVLEGSGSDLDADTLDGLDSTAFLSAGTDDWVDEAGDTMTGTLVLSPAAGNALTTTAGDVDLHDTATVTKAGERFLWDDAANGSFSAGRGALASNTTGAANTAVGTHALDANTTGANNVALGHDALGANVDGAGNTAAGRFALGANTTGGDNVALGRGALSANTTGFLNVALGATALLNNTEAHLNTAVGGAALDANSVGTGNVAVGFAALGANTIADNNVALGAEALGSNTTGFGNTAVGRRAGFYATDGNNNIFLSNEGVAGDDGRIRIGAAGTQAAAFLAGVSGVTTGGAALPVVIDAAGQLGTAGAGGAGANADTLDGLDSTDFVAAGGDAMSGPLAIDVTSGFALQTAVGDSIDMGGDLFKAGGRILHTNGGANNLALGAAALAAVTTGFSNVALGSNTLGASTIGVQNTAVGAFALEANTSGNGNVAVGANALRVNTEGGNTAVGANALDENTAGDNNVAVGFAALGANTTGLRNTAVGAGALDANTTGISNVAVGMAALGSSASANGNTAVGAFALDVNTSGGGNTAVGANTLGANTTGGSNTAVGANALIANTGGANTAVGAFALDVNTSGAGNTGVGALALDANTTAGDNTALGEGALGENTTGVGNTAVGSGAGSNATTGNNNIFINNTGLAGDAAKIRIGTDGVQTETLIAGIEGNVVAGGVAVIVGTDGDLGTVVSSRRFKEDIRDVGGASQALLALRPVSFHYTEEAAGEGERPLEYGLIAEEVAEVFPQLVVYDETGRPQTVRYRLLAPLLLNEIQRQQLALEELTARLEGYEARLAAPASPGG